MRFLYLKLTGYIGIYNGMGLDSIELDLTKSKHKLLIIKGANGSGKSTIEKALNPLPESNDFFIPGVSAKKELLLQDRDIIYKIVYNHPAKNATTRDTTKGYIYKNKVLLNPNGNISDCKNIIFNELNLDPNFVALSALSSDDRGIADKKPSDRKRFVNNILPSLDAYNNIYKKLTKKSNILKANMNTISAKIESSPTKEYLLETLKSLNSRINEIKSTKDELVKTNAVLNAEIQRLDPNGKIQNEYANLVEDLTQREKELSMLKTSIDHSLKSLNIDKDEVVKVKSELESRKIILETLISDTTKNIESTLVMREKESKELSEKIAKFQSITNDISFKDLINNIRDMKAKKEECQVIFDKMGLKDATILTKDEYITGLEKMREIKLSLDLLRDSYSYGTICSALEYLNNEQSIIDIISNTNSEISKLKSELEEYKTKSIRLTTEIDLVKALTLKPVECKIYSCPFIKEAYDKSKEEPEKKLQEVELKIQEIENSINKLNEESEKQNQINSCLLFINNNLIRVIDGYKYIFNKLPCGDSFTDFNKFYGKILNSDLFEEITEVYKYIDYSNLIDEFNIASETLKKLEEQERTFSTKQEIIVEIQRDIDSLEEKTSNLTKELEEKHSKIKNMNLELEESNVKLNRLTELVDRIAMYNTIHEQYDDNNTRYNEIWEGMNTINKSLTDIENNSKLINSYTDTLENLERDRSKIEHTIRSLEEYKVELEAYTKKYDKVEVVKRYSSPLKGIQNIFMEIYMNKIIDLSNQMLMSLFDGEYVLQPFVITADEFRIPCKGNGYINDDISSMSTAQICMISMILSFALLFQSSTKYNILHLDEIDGGLDTRNRLQFTYLLNQLMDLLECEQCIMVSHNNEVNTEDADIILLKSTGENIPGNIIWSLE